MIPLTNKEIKCHICKKGGFRDDDKIKKKSEIITTIPENLEELLIANAI